MATSKLLHKKFWNAGLFHATTNQSCSGLFSGLIGHHRKPHGRMLISFGGFFHLSILEDKDAKRGALSGSAMPFSSSEGSVYTCK